MKARLNSTKMRQEFYAWHGGQDSPLYAAASSGLVGDVEALQGELRSCAQWCQDNPRAQVGCTRDAAYLRRVADALPDLLSAPGVAWDGRTYRCLPWANKNSIDFMHPAIQHEGVQHE